MTVVEVAKAPAEPRRGWARKVLAAAYPEVSAQAMAEAAEVLARPDEAVQAQAQAQEQATAGPQAAVAVRCAVFNGTLGSGFGQKFQPANDTYPQMAIAA